MKSVKSAVLAALVNLIICFNTAPAVVTKADEVRYACAPHGSTVYFCGEKDEDKALFAIPQTYCVEILGTEGDWYYVKYAEDNGIYRAMYGYCQKDDVMLLEKPPENIYLNLVIKVAYNTDTPEGVLPPLGTLEIDAAYYGAYKVGQKEYSYVLCNENFGYVPQSVKDYPLNDLPSTPTFGKQDDGGGAKLITALAVTGVAAAAIIILFISGKKPKLNETDVTTT